MTHPSGRLVGSRLGRYQLLSLLGAGGMGEVYRARDERLARDVAVKVLPDLLSTDHERLRRFEQEARAAGSLSHPNVLTVHDIGVEAATTYLVSELLEGETLRSRLQQGTPPVRRTIELAMEICEGLAAAHDKGIVHRDLKPENVFLTQQGHAKILDFGVAKLRGVPGSEEDTGAMSAATTLEQTRGGVVLGTTAYMSPEQIRGESVDGRSDLFALGSVLYECLSGQHPFRGVSPPATMHKILSEDPPPLAVRVGPGLERVVRRCLEKRPAERFQSARDLAFALEAVSDSFHPVAERPPAGARAATHGHDPRRRATCYWLGGRARAEVRVRPGRTRVTNGLGRTGSERRGLAPPAQGGDRGPRVSRPCRSRRDRDRADLRAWPGRPFVHGQFPLHRPESRPGTRRTRARSATPRGRQRRSRGRSPPSFRGGDRAAEPSGAMARHLDGISPRADLIAGLGPRTRQRGSAACSGQSRGPAGGSQARSGERRKLRALSPRLRPDHGYRPEPGRSAPARAGDHPGPRLRPCLV